MSFPRARYLSPQFVEELCSAKGVSDGLVGEIERVIFESYSQDDREWALDFAELRDQQTSRFQQAREREAEAISDISDRICLSVLMGTHRTVSISISMLKRHCNELQTCASFCWGKLLRRCAHCQSGCSAITSITTRG